MKKEYVKDILSKRRPCFCGWLYSKNSFNLFWDGYYTVESEEPIGDLTGFKPHYKVVVDNLELTRRWRKMDPKIRSLIGSSRTRTGFQAKDKRRRSKPGPISRGTGSSKPFPSSGESGEIGGSVAPPGTLRQSPDWRKLVALIGSSDLTQPDTLGLSQTLPPVTALASTRLCAG